MSRCERAWEDCGDETETQLQCLHRPILLQCEDATDFIAKGCDDSYIDAVVDCKNEQQYSHQSPCFSIYLHRWIFEFDYFSCKVIQYFLPYFPPSHCCPQVCAITAKLAAFWNIPVISPTCADQQLLDKKVITCQLSITRTSRY